MDALSSWVDFPPPRNDGPHWQNLLVFFTSVTFRCVRL